jgi:hypothetical protein
MKKIDLKKELSHLYKPLAKKVEFVEVPKMNFLMIDGTGDPNTSKEFKEAIEALFNVSYKIKFSVKKGTLAIDYSVMPLEGLWWVDDMKDFDINDKNNWKWTLMIMQPEFVCKRRFEGALKEVSEKKDLTALSKLRFESFEEGKCAQIMHIGPFSKEGPTVEKVHEVIKEKGFKRTGKHHEIYLSDIRRGNPKNWKTVVRQP